MIDQRFSPTIGKISCLPPLFAFIRRKSDDSFIHDQKKKRRERELNLKQKLGIMEGMKKVTFVEREARGLGKEEE